MTDRVRGSNTRRMEIHTDMMLCMVNCGCPVQLAGGGISRPEYDAEAWQLFRCSYPKTRIMGDGH
jgi:hypothetical protein